MDETTIIPGVPATDEPAVVPAEETPTDAPETTPEEETPATEEEATA